MRTMRLCSAAASLLSTSLFAQPTRIDPGHADTSPTGISLLRLDIDQRIPTGFENVYQIQRPDAFGRGQTLFMRVDGAVMAIFPRSVYTPTPGGLVPEIPAGTVFQIGPIPAPIAPAAPRRLPSNYIDNAIHPEQEEAVAIAWASQRPTSSQSLITNEAYRRQRIAALLNR